MATFHQQDSVLSSATPKEGKPSTVAAKTYGKSIESVEQECHNCGKRSQNLKSCTRCWWAKYCDKECQKNHWKQHKIDCKTDQTRRGLLLVPKKTSKTDYLLASQLASYYWRKCTKHPGHAMFIPVNKFTKDNLPSNFQHDLIYESIRLTSDLTVRIIVDRISAKRPKGDSFYSARGKKLFRFGSGMVVRVESAQSGDLCPCRDCKESAKKRYIVAQIYVKTASHVVFDSSEAKATVVDLFYDDEHSISERNSKRLYGLELIKSNVSEDWCSFVCPTHDKRLVDTLLEKFHALDEINNQSAKTIPQSSASFAVIASHPHGYFKHITIGEVKYMDTSEPIQEHLSFEGDKVIFYLHSCGSIGGSGSVSTDVIRKMAIELETQPAGIEVLVLYPDQTSEKCLIWQFDQPVEETKKFLLQHGGIHQAHDNLRMIMDLPNDERQVMDDAKDIDYYWDDLTRALQIRFENHNNGG